MDYFNKYQQKFIQEKKEMAITAAVNQEISKPADPKPTSWTPNFNIVLDLADKLGINYRILQAMGSTEKQNYEDIVTGVYIPPETDDRYNTRIYVIDGHIKSLLTSYNQLRYFYRTVKPTIAMTSLISESGFERHKLQDLANLPSIIGDYNNNFQYVQRTLKPREVVTFCIQSFCELCLDVWNQDSSETVTLRHMFIKQFVARLVRSEELVSKPGYFNWALLYGNRDYDAEKQKKQKVNEDQPDDQQDDPLGTDAFDMENDFAGEEDDEGVEIHVEL